MTAIGSFVLKRILSGIVVVWAIITVVFIMEHAPGTPDPVKMILGSHFTYGGYHQLLHEYGLDVPLWQQYLQYLGLAPFLSHLGIHFGHGATQTGLLQGNFGYSFSEVGTPVWSLMSDKIPVSLKLGFYALAVSLLIGIPAGLISAMRQNSAIDHISQASLMVLHGIPTFVLPPNLQVTI